jgi:voltage-dependent potassium channel beta subunit
MEYRKLGTSGLRVSAISLGAWLTYGSNHVQEQQAVDCIRHAIDSGINLIDVADAYARGQAEVVVGQAIKPYKRSDLVVTTKAFWPMSDNINDKGLSRKHITESVNKSLKRFDMEYIDIFFCHRFDPETPLDETIRAIEDLIRQGKLLYWGTSMWTAQNIDDAYEALKSLNMNRPVVEQPLYNALERQVVEGALESAVARHGMGMIVFSPLAGGILTGKYNDGKIPEGSRATDPDVAWFKDRLTEERLSKTRQLTALAQELGTTVSALALAWVLKHPHVASAITGASRVSQVDENLKALDVTISDEVMARISEILQASAAVQG